MSVKEKEKEKFNPNKYTDRLLVYFLLTVVVITMIIGLVFILQHQADDAILEQILKNQKLIHDNTEEALENQHLLKRILNQLTVHEEAEIDILVIGNNLSANNSKKLDKILKQFPWRDLNK